MKSFVEAPKTKNLGSNHKLSATRIDETTNAALFIELEIEPGPGEKQRILNVIKQFFQNKEVQTVFRRAVHIGKRNVSITAIQKNGKGDTEIDFEPLKDALRLELVVKAPLKKQETTTKRLKAGAVPAVPGQ
ncbi:MAG: hypothetical protein WAV46_03110 [Candidatus Moraniibacteriota bacterium]